MDVQDILFALSEPTRLKALWLCQRSQLSQTELRQALDVSAPQISPHIARLIEQGLLSRVTQGRFYYYKTQISEEHKSWLKPLFAQMDADPQLVQLQSLLNDILATRTRSNGPLRQRFQHKWRTLRAELDNAENLEQAIIAQIKNLSPDTLVDLGTGAGEFVLNLAPYAGHVVGIDFDSQALDCARLSADEAGLQTIEFAQADARDTTLRDSYADVVVMHQLLRLVPRPYQAIEETARILKKRGVLLLGDIQGQEISGSLYPARARHDAGLPPAAVDKWLQDCGYTDVQQQTFSGNRFTLALWQAQKGHG